MTDIDWARLPPLTALRAFEATARLASFSAAARALNVTHAAVAQQVRALEETLGVTLVQRDGRGMTVTPDGAQLSAALSEGFATIQDGIVALQQTREGAPLKVSLTPAFAENWLMPRLGAFWAAHPETELALVPSTGLVDLRRDGYDMAIRYGDGDWPGLEVAPLTRTRFAVVGTPELVRRVTRRGGRIEDLGAHGWLTAQDSPEQDLWAESIGMDFQRTHATAFPTTSLALSATRAGYGLSIQPIALVEDDLSQGRLVALFEQEAETLGYYLLMRRGPQRRALADFANWLRRAAHSDRA
ncbi:LysR family glycine cleavage system transcriptional activator [Rhodovulum iodosum]|uniref:LysR family glycine cleavage system transcriptional activator n=1 Tax=Rhodovulum iodosum TaxID=68291 RepID=A0ABV3XT47_9RHOB|nr:LysR family transcriptional regulator [Rhodovulum robiginosum]RSK30298.1 LysR family transcriptional regulator [Rhodovulum robiginosum]